MISIPFFSKPQRSYVTAVLPSTAFLASVAGYTGVVVGQYTQHGKDKRNMPTSMVFVTVRFVIDGQERLINERLSRFQEVPPARIAPAFVAWLDADEDARAKAMDNAEARFKVAEKQRIADNKRLQKRLNRIFAASNAYWRAWAGHGGVPVDPDDPEGVNATNRIPPDIT